MTITILGGDCRSVLATLPDGLAQCCVTSPPYFGLRSYLPDTVRIRPDLTHEERAALLGELAALGVHPIAHTS